MASAAVLELVNGDNNKTSLAHQQTIDEGGGSGGVDGDHDDDDDDNNNFYTNTVSKTAVIGTLKFEFANSLCEIIVCK